LSLCTGCAMKRSSVEKERRRTVEVEAERVTAKVKMIKGHPSSSLSEFLTWAAVADIPHHSRALANASASLVRESVRRCTFILHSVTFLNFPVASTVVISRMFMFGLHLETFSCVVTVMSSQRLQASRSYHDGRHCVAAGRGRGTSLLSVLPALCCIWFILHGSRLSNHAWFPTCLCGLS
jgi:hypothetical protein